MSYIYKIENKVNGLMYIGNTSFSIEKRWKEHCHDAKTERCCRRPLYKAMNEYGIDNFRISIIECCDNSISDEREKYWINELNTFNNGYNNTLGGKGKPQVDKEHLVSVFNTSKMVKGTAREMNVCVKTVREVLKKRNDESVYTPKTCLPKSVQVFSKDGVLLETFGSLHDAS